MDNNEEVIKKNLSELYYVFNKKELIRELSIIIIFGLLFIAMFPVLIKFYQLKNQDSTEFVGIISFVYAFIVLFGLVTLIYTIKFFIEKKYKNRFINSPQYHFVYLEWKNNKIKEVSNGFLTRNKFFYNPKFFLLKEKKYRVPYIELNNVIWIYGHITNYYEKSFGMSRNTDSQKKVIVVMRDGKIFSFSEEMDPLMFNVVINCNPNVLIGYTNENILTVAQYLNMD